MPTQREMTGAVLRAARDLRDRSRNCFSDEPEALEAWKELDRAIAARDDFMVRLTEEPAKEL